MGAAFTIMLSGINVIMDGRALRCSPGPLPNIRARITPGRLGGDDVTRGLLDHVLALTALRNVTLQIVPLSADSHACLDGPVRLLETPERRRLAYAEGQQNGRLIFDAKEVSLLYQRYDTLRSQALNPKDSRGLLERLRGEL